MPDTYTYPTDYVVDDRPLRTHQDIIDTAKDEGTPAWIIASGAVLCVIGLLLIGAVAGHVWSMAACIDPGMFGLPS